MKHGRARRFSYHRWPLLRRLLLLIGLGAVAGAIDWASSSPNPSAVAQTDEPRVIDLESLPVDANGRPDCSAFSWCAPPQEVSADTKERVQALEAERAAIEAALDTNLELLVMPDLPPSKHRAPGS